MNSTDGRTLELTILMPCLNEAETLATCIEKAQGYLERSGVEGEVLISDNGSTDGSQEIAQRLGARVSAAPRRGYGAALINGIEAARGRYVIMGDADDSYDFTSLDPFVEKLRDGSDLVMGNRFAGGIEPGAMPPLHKYLGNPVLSFIGQLFFRPNVRDFHCGLRGFNRARIDELDLQTTGMEFASEMVVKASLARYRIDEVPTTLKKDGRSRPPHLRSWHDGWRHLRFLLLFAPRWLFVYPGLFAFLLGAIAVGTLAFGGVQIGGIGFDVTTMVYAAALCVIGYQSLLFFWLTKLFATQEGFLPASERYRSIVAKWTAERGLLIGLGLFGIGVLIGVLQLVRWGGMDFGPQDAAEVVRVAVPSSLGIVLGFQTIMMSFFSGVLTTPRREQKPESVIEA
ncbi:glycosyltransferase family 2 protein [Microbacterium imperiale]|uniref:Dolichol-P-glucose synthetase n=1 Tax=Microbacterium imperiale TaxID=33884 RepID=A0A9W6HE83_9MICO|nr:glycosyltransferase family 2 protein [Microbacterium imperiale]MBP2420239.1 glycosyltransferase involved in cell wall biosynthesis [Microbacterium imperiale]BFE40581.1 glycosyltransferase [Microbacterium imperiale]GLJ78445.1 dolichol-P-glucose synthetase [Microbacterium imperiale]